MKAYLFVVLGAGIGGIARHAVNVAAMKIGSVVPWHTLVVNVVGSLLMGLLIGWLTFKGNASQEWRLCGHGRARRFHDDLRFLARCGAAV